MINWWSLIVGLRRTKSIARRLSNRRRPSKNVPKNRRKNDSASCWNYIRNTSRWRTRRRMPSSKHFSRYNGSIDFVRVYLKQIGSFLFETDLQAFVRRYNGPLILSSKTLKRCTGSVRWSSWSCGRTAGWTDWGVAPSDTLKLSPTFDWLSVSLFWNRF